MAGYGAVESPGLPRRGFALRRRTGMTIALVMVAMCAMGGMFLVFHQQRSSALLQAWRRPSLAYRLSDPWELKPWQTEAYGLGSQYGFEVEPVEEVGPFGGGYPLYSAESCIPQPFADMPPGYVCSTSGYGFYVLDPYGNVYGRRVQDMVKARLGEESEAVARVNAAIGDKEKFRDMTTEHGHWVHPLKWFEPAMLPNETTCQEVIEAFYEAISSPMAEDLTNATELLADDFEYSGSRVALVPGCVPDVAPTYKAMGAEQWAAGMEKTVNAFGNSTSMLSGNATCEPERQEEDLLEPLMHCTAVHVCHFELKTMTNSSGLPVTLEGEMEDHIWINGEGQIVRMHTDFNPKHFHVLAEAENATAAAR